MKGREAVTEQGRVSKNKSLEVNMNRKFTEKNGFKKIIYSSIAVFVMMFAFIILYNGHALACEGTVQTGNHVVMKMLDPATGDLFATVKFEEVTTGGKTKMTESGKGLPSPSNYALPTEPAYYDIATEADYSGDVEVCMNYKSIGLTKPSALRVSHLENGSWEELNTTVDTEKGIICGTSPSLSQFVVFEDPRYLYGPILWYQH